MPVDGPISVLYLGDLISLYHVDELVLVLYSLTRAPKSALLTSQKGPHWASRAVR